MAQRNEAIYTNLTPAAMRLLEDVTDEVKAAILLRASGRATLYGADEIGLGDVIAALGDMGLATGMLKRRRSLPLEPLLLLTLVATGLTITIVVALAVAPGNVESWLSASAALAGALTTGVASLTFARIWQNRRAASYAAPHVHEDIAKQLLAEWIELETIMRTRVADELGESMAAEPLSKIIEAYARLSGLSEEDVSRLHGLLRLRNDIVHGRALGEVDASRLYDGLKTVQRYVSHVSQES